MDVVREILTINHHSDIPKYQQIVNAITNAVSENVLKKGTSLPSVNNICKHTKLSRDTVFKAYSLLKEYGIVTSVPNKGYYIANQTNKVLLVLDTFKAYKEVLYHSLVKNLPDNIITDVQFHHYNIDNFKILINNSIGKYYKYIIMNFDNDEIPNLISKISKEKLLIIDWDIHSSSENNFVCQDFGKSFYEALDEAVPLFKKFKRIDFIYPTFTDHPIETVHFFKKFCKNYNFDYNIIEDAKTFDVEKDVAYISVSDRMLAKFLQQSKEKSFEPGVDVGFLSYNETPMKAFIYKGISVISTDFKELGTKAAEFITNDGPLKHYVPTKLTLRESL